ncbi:DUF2399 domain-containing protein [Aneurinibacillus sp. Ricciae_BoGa-3]|uniref:DUF7281 domain-containing protein n=1 Tax=Aneurinibacillus sp. Ricciae_BoGa-3 TaxID=3022697 RepID=UPI00234081B1|nr:DUF2399 domain-containing protein [Aneurinibacillus sp. Ricciae_BoGa-3]WCK55176.1 DUF2399 domain-containing protein [Aneurinibacillus sp. Ricciae_BoGa-3]
MLDPSTAAYIEKFILKSTEQLELINPSPSDSPFTEVNIIKQTQRTFRITGVLTLGSNVTNSDDESPDDELKNMKLAPGKKVKLDDHDPTTLRWMESGWIIKEIRFKNDGKTIDSMHFRMGYRLYNYEQVQAQKKKDALEQQFESWKLGTASLEHTPEHHFSPRRNKGIQSLLTTIDQLNRLALHELEISTLFPYKWSIPKRLKFLHFVLAFLQLCLTKTDFDWKEIGASYYKKIGGSKEFDPNKEEYIATLEEWAQCPAAYLGLTSLGKITPLYFSGEIEGHYSSYHFGPVHALTDLSIAEEEYATTAATLWLVENRAVLTRFTAEKDFIKQTNSLVLCVDGHLRTSHKQCIHQLLKNSALHQVIIWSDYDPDGLQIAKELYTAVSQHGTLNVKWITHNHQVITNWQQYEDYMLAFLKHHQAEQEQVTGGVEDWRKWIGL